MSSSESALQNKALWRCTFQRIALAARLALTLLVVASQGRAQESVRIHGVVRDSTGAVIRGAQIECRSERATMVAASGDDGTFSLQTLAPGGTLKVSYPGFSTFVLELKGHAPAEDLHVVLSPAPALQRIDVNASEDRVPAVPLSQYSVSDQQIQNSGALVIDDILRSVPGFSTFRRSSSLFANPTSQGTSLRGVGASATSRSTVLLDGIPLNDPFGSWVYWGRVPASGIESMEISNGGASDLYGNGALGGVINLRTHSAETPYASGEISYGSLSTPDISFAAGAPVGGWTISGMGQAFRTGGYILIPAGQRGSVDTDASTGDLAGILEIGHSLGEQGRFFVRGSGFAESRSNGTFVTKNDTTIPEIDTGADWSSTRWGSFSARLYGSTEFFHQTFSAVSSVHAPRDTEFLTDDQHTPSQQVGLVTTWSRLVAEKHKISAGFEAHDVRGHSAETTFSQSVPSALVDAGGRQHFFGYFAQDAFLIAPSWVLTYGGRVDTWNNNTGYQNRTPLLGGAPTALTFPERTETAFSPRVSITHSLRNGLALNASVYRAFRAPTLNELYRNFRQGNTSTMANPALTGEHLTGGEAGISAQRFRNRLTIRSDFFWSDISDPVANVTLTSTPTLITRQKQNLGVTQARGFELSGQFQLTSRLQLAAEYLFVNSTVVSYSANPVLVGLFVPQVPQNQFNAQISYQGKNWSAGVQGRFLGNQFDDDLNTFPLGRAFSLDAQVSRQLAHHTSIFFAVQNLTNDRFAIAETPVTNVGPPLFVRGGFRFNLR